MGFSHFGTHTTGSDTSLPGKAVSEIYSQYHSRYHYSMFSCFGAPQGPTIYRSPVNGQVVASQSKRDVVECIVKFEQDKLIAATKLAQDLQQQLEQEREKSANRATHRQDDEDGEEDPFSMPSPSQRLLSDYEAVKADSAAAKSALVLSQQDMQHQAMQLQDSVRQVEELQRQLGAARAASALAAADSEAEASRSALRAAEEAAAQMHAAAALSTAALASAAAAAEASRAEAIAAAFRITELQLELSALGAARDEGQEHALAATNEKEQQRQCEFDTKLQAALAAGAALEAQLLDKEKVSFRLHSHRTGP